MRHLRILMAGLLLFTFQIAKADEGMWLLPLLKQLNIEAMQEKGFKLTAEDIYSINNSSLKDAILIFGGGCTGEIISDQGLILTNHHCGYGAIQQHSTTEHDYLADGFWANSKEEEIPTPGLSATFMVSMEDVTDKVNGVLNPSMSEAERDKAIAEIGKTIAADATKGTSYRGAVRSFFGGNQFFLVISETFSDVRMVGAPPSSIGKFGADTDNWMWPRHTCDFSIFRIYADKDNNPAPYAEDNVPYKPKYSLPISLKGVKKGDFAMIVGHPGSTQRYMTSSEVNERMNITNADRINVRGIRQDILMEDMLADRAVNIKYASKYSGSSNYWKNSIGMNRALKRLKVYDYKKSNEEEFTKWVNASPERITKYGEALKMIEEAVAARKDYLHANLYFSEVFRASTELISFASAANMLIGPLKSGKKEDIDKATAGIRNYGAYFYKNYNAPTDRKVTKAMFKLFAENVPARFQPDIYQTINGKYKGNYDKFVDDLFNKSFLVDSVKLYAFLEKPNLNKLEKDPAVVAAQSINKKNRELSQQLIPFNEQIQKGQRLYIAGVLEKNQGKALAPDANFTMRLTYGEILDYYPANAIHYDYITTLEGVMEKEDPDNWEFVVPQKLKDLYNSKDYGRYAEKGQLPVNFISTNDITGGNSGSPVINGNGELIGCVFDGNWEAMSGDIVFEKNLQRSISVDIRYVLFIIDKYAGATHLIDEMKIIE